MERVWVTTGVTKILMLLPSKKRYDIAPRYRALAELLMKDYDFLLYYADDWDPAKIEASGIDVVLNCNSPQFGWPDSMKSLPRLDASVKLITYPGDLHWHSKEQGKKFLPRMRAMLERSDVILYGAYSRFRRTFPEFVGKSEYFPPFFSPHRYYAGLPYNRKPIMEAALPGAIYSSYPFRQYVQKLKHPSVQRIAFSGRRIKPKKGNKVGAAFAKELNRFFCCVTCGSKFNIVTIKHAEIPAAGALLLTEVPSDLHRMGFVAGEHYIPVNTRNFVGMLEDVIGHPEKYEPVRKAGRKFVLANHSVRNRYARLKEIIARLEKN